MLKAALPLKSLVIPALYKRVPVCRASRADQKHLIEIAPNLVLMEKVIVTLSRKTKTSNAITSMTVIFVAKGIRKIDRTTCVR